MQNCKFTAFLQKHCKIMYFCIMHFCIIDLKYGIISSCTICNDNVRKFTTFHDPSHGKVQKTAYFMQ